MKPIFIILFILFTYACSNTNEKKEIIIDDEKNSLDTTAIPKALIDNNIHFFQRNDTAFLSKGLVILSSTKLKTKQRLGDTINGNEYLADEAFMVANCMIVLRGVHVLGDFCHMPSVKSIEIHTAYGDVLTPKTGYFQGNIYTAPSGKWGIITEEAEGEIFGYTFINEHGKIHHTDLNPFLSGYMGDQAKTYFLGDTCLFFEKFERDFRNHHSQLSIFEDASFMLSITPLDTDSIQFVFFNELEPLIYKNQPYWYVEFNEHDSSYAKSFLDMRKNYSKEKMSYVNFDSYIKQQNFMFTGIPNTSKPLNIRYVNKELENKDSLYITKESYIKVEIDYIKAQQISFIDKLKIKLYHNIDVIHLIDSTCLDFVYQGERAIKVFSKAIGDLNGDGFTDFLFIIDSDLCHKNIAVLSELNNTLTYKTVYVNEFCWD
jgi:hypothetical protein